MTYRRYPLSDQMPGSMLNDLVNTAVSTRITISPTGHATPFTTGTYTDIDTSLSADANGIQIDVTSATFVSATNSSTFLEIGVDTSGGTSYTLWATISVGYRNFFLGCPNYILGFIPAGSRVAVRVRSAIVSKLVTANFHFLPVKNGRRFGQPITYGADTATAQGVTLTAPGSLNSKGADLSLVTSTAERLVGLCLGVQGVGGTAMSSTGVLLDIRYDPTGGTTYQTLIADIYLLGNGSEYYIPNSPLAYGVDIPAGSRLAARYARANAANALDLVMVGVTAG